VLVDTRGWSDTRRLTVQQANWPEHTDQTVFTLGAAGSRITGHVFPSHEIGQRLPKALLVMFLPHTIARQAPPADLEPAGSSVHRPVAAPYGMTVSYKFK
jgi:hypothetical protein